MPDRRPALVGSGPDSLVNLIETQALMQKGQHDAWVMFRCVVGPDGRVGEVITYRVSPEADLLKQEVSRRLKKARFTPPVYNHHWTYASVSGTVVFVISQGQPRLRVYENQEMDELKRGSDFIAPRPVYVPISPPSNVGYPGHADPRRLPFEVERPSTEIDDAVMTAQDFRPEQTGDRERRIGRIVVKQFVQVGHTHLLVPHLDRPDREA